MTLVLTITLAPVYLFVTTTTTMEGITIGLIVIGIILAFATWSCFVNVYESDMYNVENIRMVVQILIAWILFIGVVFHINDTTNKDNGNRNTTT